ncbi:YbhN family protein [Haloplanus sp. GCM10025708]|uniref:lysylphosphatidylglycerol synthase transmembrane domain-containing protein n=1 Tax=Haloferacaceae TaxID=1644056 RepID=UPI00360B7A76
MTGEKVRATILGFAGALAAFALLFTVAGYDRLVAQLSQADAGIVGLVFLATLGWLAAWGFALRVVLSVLGVSLSVFESFFVFAAAMFSNNVTPFGQAGGEPVTALLISEVGDTEYETGLAAIASVDTLNFVPSITIAVVGAGYFLTEVAFGTNPRIELAITAIAVLAVGVPAAVFLGWQHRYGLEERVIRGLTPLARRVARRIPRVPVPTASGVERRINGFFRAIERVAANPRGLALALALSSLGWLFQMVGLWLAFQAIETPIPLSIALLVVPIGAIAGVTPLPGGAGGIESVLVVLLVAAPLPLVTESVAVAAIVIFRGMVYWTPTVLGGAVTGYVSLQKRG